MNDSFRFEVKLFSVSFYSITIFYWNWLTNWKNLEDKSVKNLLKHKTAWDHGATYCTGLAASSLLFYKNLFFNGEENWTEQLRIFVLYTDYGHTMKTLNSKLDLNLVYVKSLQYLKF